MFNFNRPSLDTMVKVFYRGFILGIIVLFAGAAYAFTKIH